MHTADPRLRQTDPRQTAAVPAAKAAPPRSDRSRLLDDPLLRIIGHEIVSALCTRVVFQCCTSNRDICHQVASAGDVKMLISSRALQTPFEVAFTLAANQLLHLVHTRSSFCLETEPLSFCRCFEPMFEVMMMIVFL